MLGNEGPPAGVWGTTAVAALWLGSVIGAVGGLLRPRPPAVRLVPARVVSR